MSRFSFALRKRASKKEGASSGGLWVAALLFAGLIILSAPAPTYSQTGSAPLSIEVSASVSQVDGPDYSHALEVSWKATGGTPPHHVTLEITGPDGITEVHDKEASEGTRQFKLAYPEGGTVLVNVKAEDSSGSSASGMTSVSLAPSPRVEIDEGVLDKGVLACRKMAFSTEEDFVTQGPEPADGNPIISDGDLLGEGCVVCARNADLLQGFKVTVDLGLDAVDIIDVDRYLVAFSTELDSPNTGQFTAGDLLITNGAIIPNAALLYGFGLRMVDLGLDAVHFVGESGRIIEFLDYVRSAGREYWLREGALQASLRQYGLDIWFSTEGTGPYPTQPAFLDGDLLSARDGIIVARNSLLLPPGVPAGIPNRGVDFGLDAVTCDRAGNRENIHFSTEILYKREPSFTDGDVLLILDGVVYTNKDLVHCFEPKSSFLGLDALYIDRP